MLKKKLVVKKKLKPLKYNPWCNGTYIRSKIEDLNIVNVNDRIINKLFRLFKKYSPKHRIKLYKWVKKWLSRGVYIQTKQKLKARDKYSLKNKLTFFTKKLRFLHFRESKKKTSNYLGIRYNIFRKNFVFDRYNNYAFRLDLKFLFSKVNRYFKLKKSFRKRSRMKRLSNLFFFWFLLLYKDLYRYLVKIIWSLWFKFIYLFTTYLNHNRLFSLISNFNILPYNNFFLFFDGLYPLVTHYNSNLFFDYAFSYTLGSLGYLLLSNRSFYNLEYISFSFNKFVNLYIHKQRWNKKNLELQRSFRLKV